MISGTVKSNCCKPLLTWLSCPGTSLYWCGREAPWCSWRQDSPADPGSGSPWRPAMRPWKCSSLWLPGSETGTGWNWCILRDRAAAPASEAGRLLWSRNRTEQRIKTRWKEVWNIFSLKNWAVKQAHTNHRLNFHFYLVDNWISVCIWRCLLISIQNKNAMSFKTPLMFQGLRSNLEIPHLTCHNSSCDWQVWGCLMHLLPCYNQNMKVIRIICGEEFPYFCKASL